MPASPPTGGDSRPHGSAVNDSALLPLRLAAALLALGLAALPACRRAAPDPATLAKTYIQYPVSKGETLESISKQFFVKPEQLRKVNHLGRTEQPAPGRTILIPRWK